MQPVQLSVQVVIQYLGLISQAATVLLLVVLFVMLRRYADRRAYFYTWSNAWVALAVALTVLVLRYILLPHLLGGPAPEGAVLVRVSYFIYQFSKFTFLILLLRGTLLYTGGLADPPLGYVKLLWLTASAAALISVVVTSDAVGVLFWQSFANLIMFSWCAAVLLFLPRTRHSLGTRTMGVVMVLNVLLWLCYVLAFTFHFFPQLGVGAGVWNFFSGRNVYFDLILDMLLAFGMVLVLFEDARREIDSAHRELRIAHEQLLRESFLDSLTGAYNRRAFNEGAGLEDARGSFGALAVFDLDNLKDVNDKHGHKYGDELLRHFANILRAGLRANDKLYRLGGDEFLLVMPRAVEAVVEKRMRELIGGAPPLEIPGTAFSFPVSASIGVAAFKSVEQLEAAVHDADRAMYSAKRSRKRGR
ncbi:MAG TPA: GGDEF domain-containing protein [Gammaproteobacteria bacterium]|jgi:diguanylate cyclase (GGDEF)-like protein